MSKIVEAKQKMLAAAKRYDLALYGVQQSIERGEESPVVEKSLRNLKEAAHSLASATETYCSAWDNSAVA